MKHSITPIDTRKQIIMKAVVTDYVRTAEPVGSHTLAERHHFGVKSATIRNELAELAEMGYLHQPHTSAGRIPSDLGYRLYVDRLMEWTNLNLSEAESAKDKLSPHRGEVDLIVEQTCRILSELARYTSLATRPAIKGARVSHVSIANVGPNRQLAVVVLSNGQILHQLIELNKKSNPVDPVRATNFLSQTLRGQPLDTIVSLAGPAMDDAPDMKGLLVTILEFLRREAESADERDVHLEGASFIMQQPEFKDLERLEALLSVLERRKALFKLFSSVYLGPEVTVIIGSENPMGEMRDCSFVGANYRINSRIAGTIGLIGPTRMDYPRAVGAVEFMARNLSDLLTALSVA